MSESYDPNLDPNFDADVPEEVDEEQESQAIQSPRRAASAEFLVTSEVGSESSLRDAMDPANQSLADALKLSFRVLQLVILILIVAFFSSGVTTVPDKFSGVLTRWGKIVPYQDEVALGSGFKWSGWPYPVSEFIIFEAENRTVNITSTFLPNSRSRGYSIPEHLEKARANDRPKTGIDGQLLTIDGDIAHVAATVVYRIDEPEKFVQNLPIDQADNVVRWATEQAMIIAVAQMTLQDLTDVTDEVSQRIKEGTQQALNDMGVGIRIAQVTLPYPPRPPYSILKTFEELQTARVNTTNSIKNAELNAVTERNKFAGQRWHKIISLIDQYEVAEDLNDQEAIVTHLAAITDWLDHEASGQASVIISNAHRYQSQIDSSLGNEAKRFASLLQSFRKHPDLAVRQPWMNAIAFVLGRPDAETFSVPGNMGAMGITISGSDEIANERRDLKLDRKNDRAMRAGDYGPTFRRAQDMSLDKAGRLLNINEGKIEGQGVGRNN